MKNLVAVVVILTFLFAFISARSPIRIPKEPNVYVPASDLRFAGPAASFEECVRRRELSCKLSRAVISPCQTTASEEVCRRDFPLSDLSFLPAQSFDDCVSQQVSTCKWLGNINCKASLFSTQCRKLFPADFIDSIASDLKFAPPKSLEECVNQLVTGCKWLNQNKKCPKSQYTKQCRERFPEAESDLIGVKCQCFRAPCYCADQVESDLKFAPPKTFEECMNQLVTGCKWLNEDKKCPRSQYTKQCRQQFPKVTCQCIRAPCDCAEQIESGKKSTRVIKKQKVEVAPLSEGAYPLCDVCKVVVEAIQLFGSINSKSRDDICSLINKKTYNICVDILEEFRQGIDRNADARAECANRGFCAAN
jgi:hypothetical protein